MLQITTGINCLFIGYEVDCFMNKPFENEDLLGKVDDALTTIG